MNMPTGSMVAKNASWYTFASIAQKLMAFLYFSITARLIGPDDIGAFIFAVSITVVLGSLIDLGLTPVLIRNSAQKNEELPILSKSILNFKLLTSLVSFLALVVIVIFWGKSYDISVMTLMAGVVMCADSIALTLWGILRSQHNLRAESTSMIFTQLITSSVGITGILLDFPIWNLATALLLGSLFNVFFGLYKSRSVIFGIKTQQSQIGVLRSIWRAALPFALAAIFTRLYSYADQVLLATLIGERALGLYSVPYKLTFALQFIPAAFAASIYPAMSAYHQHAQEKLSGIYNKSIYFLLLISAPIAAGTIAIAPNLIHLLYTSTYDASILTLQVLILALIPSFLSFPVGSLLNATHNQYQNTLSMGLTMVINIGLNFILIPKFSHLGAAVATVISLSFLALFNMIYAWVKLKQKIDHISVLVKIVVSSFLMFLIVDYSENYLNILFSILLGIFAYTVFIFVFNVVKKDEMQFILSLLRRKEKINPEVI